MILQRPTGRRYAGFGLSVSYTNEAQAQLVTGAGLAVPQDVNPIRLWLIENWKVAALSGASLALALGAYNVLTRKRKRRR